MGDTTGKLANRFHLLGLSQLLLNLQFLRNVHETADHPHRLLTIPHRQNTVGDRERAAIPAPEQFVFNHVDYAGFTHPVGRTLLSRIVTAV